MDKEAYVPLFTKICGFNGARTHAWKQIQLTRVKSANNYFNFLFISEIREMFRVFDKDGDKSLSVEELGKAMKGMGLKLTYKEVQLAAKQMDKDSKCHTAHTMLMLALNLQDE